MTSTVIADLSAFSQALADLVEKAAVGAVAVKSAPYRVVSGLIVREDLIAVANHTLRREDRIPIQTLDGSQAAGTILGRDPTVDLAFLKVDGGKLKPLTASDPASLKAGTLAAVVGLTIDAGPSASLGILGAVGGSRRTWRGGTLEHFFRLDVNLYPSQSGAAVVDAEGHLIGLATPGLLRHSAVAVPVATLHRIAEELLKEGRIRHGYLGVSLHPVAVPAALRAKLGVAAESGLILLSVEPESPADKAGWQIGDILISLDDEPIIDVDELQTALRGNTVGRSVKASSLRGGELVETQVTVSERKQKES
ncbi:MAG: S1C family serine protease [Bryobacteraceae bacterium]